jgi:hypothetical protein
MHSIKNNLALLGHSNSHLADELAKLPEICKYKTNSSRLALDNLLKIYRFAPDCFDLMFAAMDTIGLPCHRNYCSPLQALFWLIQDEKQKVSGILLGLNIAKTTGLNGNCRPQLASAPDTVSAENNPAGSDPHYTLEKILDAAWNGESRLMPGSAIHKIIRRIQAKAESEEYMMLLKRRTDRQLQSYIMDDFLRKKEIFSVKDWDAIDIALQQSRWKLFYTVADRLNSPELISYYINQYFFFRKTPASGVYSTFFNKNAQCTDAAYFTQFMLKRAGYKTFMRSVKWDQDPWDGLHTAAGIVLDDNSYLVVSNYTGINALAGPFADLENLDRKLSCGKKIIGRKWGAYYPPRYY